MCSDWRTWSGILLCIWRHTLATQVDPFLVFYYILYWDISRGGQYLKVLHAAIVIVTDGCFASIMCVTIHPQEATKVIIPLLALAPTISCNYISLNLALGWHWEHRMGSSLAQPCLDSFHDIHTVVGQGEW